MNIINYFRINFSASAKNIFRLASANALASTIGLIGTFIQSRTISPEELGYFKGFEIATGYAFFLHLGIFGAFQKNYSFYIGRNEIETAEKYARISYSWNLMVSFLVGGSFFIASIVFFLMGNWKAGLALIVQASVIISYFFGGHLSVLFNSTNNFKTLSINTFIGSVASAISFPFYFIWPYVSMAFRASIGNIIGFFYLHHRNTLKFKFKIRIKETYLLIKEGLPMFLASYGAGIGWDTIEKTLILYFIDQNGLGLWSFSFMLISILKLIPQAINAVYIPQIIQNYGKSLNPKETLMFTIKPMIWATPLVIFMIVLGIFLMPHILPILMPKYIDAIPILSILLFILPMEIISLPYALMIAKGEVLHQNISTYVSLILFIIFASITIRLGFGIFGIIISSIVCRIFKLGIIYLYIRKYIMEHNLSLKLKD